MKVRLLAVASLFAVSITAATAVTVTENFSANPLQNGWKIFGNSNLFVWNATNQNVEVTWDSTNVNSYLARPLGTVLTRDDDFSLSFDLRLDDVQVSGFGVQIAVGLLKWADATNNNFNRVVGANANNSPHNVLELDYFPADGSETISPTIISQGDSDYGNYDQWASGFYYPNALSNGETFRVHLTFTAANQSLATVITRNGEPWNTFPSVIPAATFKGFQLDALAVSCYDGSGAFGDMTLAHGAVDNFTVTLPPPPVQNLAGQFSGGQWQCAFISRSNWLYALERSTNLVNWTAISSNSPGVDGLKVLSDTSSPIEKSFYRVRADRP